MSRFLITSALTLTCSVNIVRSRYPTNNCRFLYFINDGVYGSFSNILINNQTLKVKTLKEFNNQDMYLSSIWGSIYDELDSIVEDILLPELETGDLICFEDMGAYTLSLAGSCNGLPMPKVFLVATEEIWLRLKDSLPFFKEHLENENIPHKRSDSNMEGGLDWSLPQFPITVKSKYCDGSVIEEYVLDYATTC